MRSRTQTRIGDPGNGRSATTPPRCRRLLSLEQAARASGKPIEVIRRLVADGELEAYEVAHGQIRIDEAELAELLSLPGRKGRPRVTPGPEARETGATRSLRLLSIQEAAQFAKVSTQTVRRWIKSGSLKFYRGGRQLRIDESDLVDFLSCEVLK
jgi:excisionase family DNA binding protein